MKASDETKGLSDAETVRRREDALKRMLSTPRTAHAEQPKKTASRAKPATRKANKSA
jgi:hypothetical protein